MKQQWPSGLQIEEAAAFAAVAEQASFTQAAALLGRDATVLSRRVAALERRLGVRLLERTTRRVALTEAGQAFLSRLQAGLSAWTEAEASASAYADGAPRGILRLALPTSFARMWIAPFLPEFLAAHPHLRIQASFSNAFADLVGGGFDAAVRIGSLPDSRLVARRIAPHCRLLCASPAYLARRGIPATPADLAAHDCLGFTGFASHPLWHLSNRLDGSSARVRVDGPLVSDDSEALVHAAVQGLGVMLCTDWLVGRELGQGQLVPILGDWLMEGEGAIYTVVPSNQFLAPKTRAFVDWIAARFAPVPPWRCAHEFAPAA